MDIWHFKGSGGLGVVGTYRLFEGETLASNGQLWVIGNNSPRLQRNAGLEFLKILKFNFLLKSVS